MSEDWIMRWKEGRIGWHEACGNQYLKQHWPIKDRRNTVLVPLCGKSVDMIWLASQGHEVIGVELSSIAIESFFAESNLDFSIRNNPGLDYFQSASLPIRIYCGDYFDYSGNPADALYDRGALGTMPMNERQGYVEHTKSLLTPDAFRMIISLEYDQDIVNGPPYSVLGNELEHYWPDLKRIAWHDDRENCPPKFKAAGIVDVVEAVWVSA